ncbi:MAG: hypothetical protein Q7S14_02000 [bacterium]|nr:hypothetical protein [bacterium]
MRIILSTIIVIVIIAVLYTSKADRPIWGWLYGNKILTEPKNYEECVKEPFHKFFPDGSCITRYQKGFQQPSTVLTVRQLEDEIISQKEEFSSQRKQIIAIASNFNLDSDSGVTPKDWKVFNTIDFSLKYPENWFYLGGVFTNYKPVVGGSRTAYENETKCDIVGTEEKLSTEIIYRKVLQIKNPFIEIQVHDYGEPVMGVKYSDYFFLQNDAKTKSLYFICYAMGDEKTVKKILSSVVFN